VLRLGEEEAAHDLQVSEIGLVVAPEGPPVRDRHRDVEAKLEALIQGQIELEQTRVLVAVLEEILGVAVGRDAEGVEHAVEGIEPPLPRSPPPPFGGLTQARSQPSEKKSLSES